MINRIFMCRTHFLSLLFFVITGIFFSSSVAFGDDDNPATLADVHKILLQAAGYQSDTPPTSDEQTELLNKALKMIAKIPHAYHGQLKAATRDINAALSELSNGDPAHKAKEDIYDADDQIKAIM